MTKRTEKKCESCGDLFMEHKSLGSTLSLCQDCWSKKTDDATTKQNELLGNHYLWLDKKPRYTQPILFTIALIVCLYLLVRLCKSPGWEQFNCGR